jgi:hypothetical protein
MGGKFDIADVVAGAGGLEGLGVAGLNRAGFAGG